MKKYKFAHEVVVGDTLCFGDPQSRVTVERISKAESDGAISLWANIGTWTSRYKPTDRIRVLVATVQT